MASITHKFSDDSIARVYEALFNTSHLWTAKLRTKEAVMRLAEKQGQSSQDMDIRGIFRDVLKLKEPGETANIGLMLKSSAIKSILASKKGNQLSSTVENFGSLPTCSAAWFASMSATYRSLAESLTNGKLVIPRKLKQLPRGASAGARDAQQISRANNTPGCSPRKLEPSKVWVYAPEDLLRACCAINPSNASPYNNKLVICCLTFW